MKRFISKVQNLSRKAAELKAAMQQVPPKVAEIREAVTATAGQLQQLKTEIQFSVADLKADQEDHLSEALQEINNSADVFAKAGFALSGMDLEISPVQRMLVHLARMEDAHAAVLRSLLQANQHRRTTRAILSSLLQAKQMAETVKFGDLIYDEVVVGIGPIPSVRLCWRSAEVEEVDVAPRQTEIPLPQAFASSATASQSGFGPSSFFEKQETHPAPVVMQTRAPEAPSPIVTASDQVTAHKPPVSHVPEVSTDPLARFKKMPDLSRLKR